MHASTATTSRVRRATAAGCALVAAGYLFTGSGAVAVTIDQPAGVIPPLLLAALLFSALAVLALRTARRSVWVAGAVLQLVVIVMYIVVAAERTPPYEPWGVGLKLLQGTLLVAFGWLALRPADISPSAPSRHPRRYAH